jgi:predicted PurR-regulated permease PerM
MPDDSNANNRKPGKPGLSWFAAITAATGLLAAFVIAVLRLGKSPRPSAQPPDYQHASLPSKASKVQPQALQAHPASRAQNAPVSPALKDQTPGRAGVVRTPQSENVPADKTRWSMTTKYIVGTGIFLSVLFLIYLSRGSLSMIIFAALIAFVIRPLISWLQRQLKLKRGAATGITYLLVIILLITLPVLLIPPILDAINYLLNIDFQTVAQNLNTWLQAATTQVQSIPIVGNIFSPLLESLSLALQDFSTAAPPATIEPLTYARFTSQLTHLMGILVNVLGPLVSGAMSFIFMLLISLHMSLSAETLQKSYPRLIPEPYRPEISALIERIVNVWSSFLRGQLSLMVVMGVLTFLLNWLLGTPYPLFLGFLAGVLEIIPSLGPFLATIPAVLLALFVGSTRFAIDPLIFALIVIAGYILLSAMENQIIVPKILGDAVSLPPLVVIIGVVIFGALFGILGIFLATPVISTGKEIYVYLYDKILETPVQEPPEDKPALLDKLRGMIKRIHLPSFQKPKKAKSAPEVVEYQGALKQSNIKTSE